MPTSAKVRKTHYNRRRKTNFLPCRKTSATGEEYKRPSGKSIRPRRNGRQTSESLAACGIRTRYRRQAVRTAAMQLRSAHLARDGARSEFYLYFYGLIMQGGCFRMPSSRYQKGGFAHTAVRHSYVKLSDTQPTCPVSLIHRCRTTGRKISAAPLM